MKNLLFLCGPNGIGKTTISQELLNNIPNSAYVDSDPCRMMNPFVLDDATIPIIAKNMGDLISNYFNCTTVNTVIFSYGFHGRRKEVFEMVMSNISSLEYKFSPILLWCDLEENINRMKSDNRSEERIQRTIEESRKAFGDVSYPKIDITHLSVKESAKHIIEQAG